MHKNTPKSFFYLDFWEVVYVQKYNCTVLLKYVTMIEVYYSVNYI